MKIYSKISVLDAALNRIRYLFDEFPTVVVATSAGKDSTVVLNLALQVAEEKGRLPLKVMFIDQEAEWESTITHIREIFADPRVEPMWMQVEFFIENGASTTTTDIHVWDPNKPEIWMRPKEPHAYKDNKYGIKVWADTFPRITDYEFKDTKMCLLGGVRCEESMSRRNALTFAATYKHITAGKVLNKRLEHFTFYPIYDWAISDVWKYINENNFSHNSLYSKLFRYGVKPRDMRVSNLNHEIAIRNLLFLQEIEPKTWNALCKRLDGVASVGQMKTAFLKAPKVLPKMFSGWREYRDYLLKHLILDQDQQKILAKQFAHLDVRYDTYPDLDGMYRMQINAILCTDYQGTKMANWEASPQRFLYIRAKYKPDAHIYAGDHAKMVVPNL